jgi:hypothetical protein
MNDTSMVGLAAKYARNPAQLLSFEQTSARHPLALLDPTTAQPADRPAAISYPLAVFLGWRATECNSIS